MVTESHCSPPLILLKMIYLRLIHGGCEQYESLKCSRRRWYS